ncbi:hypothetical protein [Streptomyces sp. NPDC006551]|uniref:nSTAND1 domain-containing NTPase n=1 Tax=Streptomyces sp. NPDC006551 TaxID=3157178 RepID=UPI0033B5409F
MVDPTAAIVDSQSAWATASIPLPGRHVAADGSEDTVRRIPADRLLREATSAGTHEADDVDEAYGAGIGEGGVEGTGGIGEGAAREGRSVTELLDRLVAARLVTLDQNTAQISHEALLHAWPLLRRSIDEDRAELVLRQQMADDADTWAAAGRGTAFLYQGTRLHPADELFQEDRLPRARDAEFMGRECGRPAPNGPARRAGRAVYPERTGTCGVSGRRPTAGTARSLTAPSLPIPSTATLTNLNLRPLYGAASRTTAPTSTTCGPSTSKHDSPDGAQCCDRKGSVGLIM